jgi:hypothetical protein
MDANSASLSQPSTAPLSTAIPGFSYHLSQWPNESVWLRTMYYLYLIFFCMNK